MIEVQLGFNGLILKHCNKRFYVIVDI